MRPKFRQHAKITYLLDFTRLFNFAEDFEYLIVQKRMRLYKKKICLFIVHATQLAGFLIADISPMKQNPSYLKMEWPNLCSAVPVCTHLTLACLGLAVF